MTGRRKRLLLSALAATTLVVAVGWFAAGRHYVAAQGISYAAGQHEHGRVAIAGGLAFAEVAGTAEQRGTAIGALFREQIPPLLGLMAVQPRLAMKRGDPDFQAVIAAISPEDRAAIAAIARSAGVDESALLAANAIVDAQCSAVVAAPAADRPLRVARNMDFFPAEVLGPATVCLVERDPAARAFVAIGWPGSLSVISGMNDAGLVACILLNHRGPDVTPGEPLGLRVRRILRSCATVAEAEAAFRAQPVGSSHYLLLADAKESAVVWREPQGVRSDRLAAGWLVASNGLRRDGDPTDDRGCHLRTRIGALGAGVPDDAWMRGVLSASYMPRIAAQAMTFVPATGTIELALGEGHQPAALRPWQRIEAKAWLAGGQMPVSVALPPVIAQPHYRR